MGNIGIIVAQREQIGGYTDQVTANESNGGSPLARRDLTSPEVFVYIREHFEWDDPISEELRNLPIEHGSVFSFLPVGFRLESPTAIRQEAFRGRKREMYELTVRFVSDYLRTRQRALALFLSMNYKGDPILSKRTTSYVFLAETSENRKPVCLFLTSDHASEVIVAKAFEEARAFMFLAVLTTLPEGWSLRHSDELPQEQARILARSAHYLIVDAFDGMAHLVWSRDIPNEGEIAR